MDVKATLDRLVRLQELDSQLTRVDEELAAGPPRLAEIEQQLRGAREAVEVAKSHLQKASRDRRDLEGQVETVQQKISRHQTQMMAVKTNVEYRGLTKEIEHEKTLIANIEEKVLEAMERVEELEKGVKAQMVALIAEERRVEQEKQVVRDGLTRLERDRKDVLQEREEALVAVPEEAMALYRRLTESRAGLAVAKVEGESCGVCRVRNRPQALAEAREFRRLVQCESCGRILAAPPLPPSTIALHADLIDDD